MIAGAHLLWELIQVFHLDPLIASATGKIIGKFDVPPPEWVRRHLHNYYLSPEPERPDELIISADDLDDLVFS
jgi:hypothetical protein